VFNGVNQKIEIPYTAETNTACYSFAAWYRPDACSGGFNCGRGVSLKTSDGQVVALEQGAAMIGDEIVIRSPSGQFNMYRQPMVINEQLDQQPYVYLKQGTLEELVTDGCLGEPYVHADDQSFYWTARTCTNPDCDSQTMGSGDRPYLFVKQLPGVKLMEGGRVDFTGVSPDVLEAPIVCPVCNKKEHIVDYLTMYMHACWATMVSGTTSLRSKKALRRSYTSTAANPNGGIP
jgi:hypothetical protein